MTTITATSVVAVGVNGTRANRGAVRYAIAEAQRRGGRLALVHVVPDYVPLSPMLPLASTDLTETGTAVLAYAEEAVRELAPDLEVETRLRRGSRSTALASAEDAELLVVGRDDRSVLTRLLSGDTATRTAARASVPVVQVPPGWRAGTSRSREHPFVVVGVRSPAHAAELLEHAFEVASSRAATLVVLHAWKLPSAYDDLIESRVALERCQRDGVDEMEILLRDWRRAYPDVEVEIRVVHDHPDHALVEASRTADLLVLVRRAWGIPAAAHLGSTARSVLRSAHCPVLVVPAARAGTSGPALEAAGELEPSTMS